MRTNKRLLFILEKSDTGFSAYCEKYPIYTTGNSIPELIQNAWEATTLYFEEEENYVRREDLKFEIDWKQFFKYYRVLNAKYLAEKIQMNPSLLSQYIQGKKKPSEQQTQRIFRGIQEIGKELSELRFGK